MGMANVYAPPAVGTVDAHGFTLRDVVHYVGNGPPTEVWSKRNAERRITSTEHRVQGQVVQRHDTPDEALTNWAGNNNWIYSYSGNALRINSATTAYKAEPDHKKEQDDMAQRQDFTFPYTGQEIADALSRKIGKLTDTVTSLHSLDETALGILYDYEMNRTAKEQVERKVKALQTEVEKLVKERAPYAKAGSKQSFDIDLEDIEHFGLNDEDTPAPKKVRRKRAAAAEAPAESSE